jgi:hypothetical protein
MNAFCKDSFSEKGQRRMVFFSEPPFIPMSQTGKSVQGIKKGFSEFSGLRYPKYSKNTPKNPKKTYGKYCETGQEPSARRGEIIKAFLQIPKG